MADLHAELEVRGVRAQDLGDHLPPHAHAVEHVVCRRLAGHLAEEWGVCPQRVHDILGLGSYETAWAWLRKLRRAMVRPDREQLSGVVEVDESFVGGRTPAKDGASTDKYRS